MRITQWKRNLKIYIIKFIHNLNFGVTLWDIFFRRNFTTPKTKYAENIKTKSLSFAIINQLKFWGCPSWVSSLTIINSSSSSSHLQWLYSDSTLQWLNSTVTLQWLYSARELPTVLSPTMMFSGNFPTIFIQLCSARRRRANWTIGEGQVKTSTKKEDSQLHYKGKLCTSINPRPYNLG